MKNKCFECKNLTFRQLGFSKKGYHVVNFCGVNNEAIIDRAEEVKKGCKDFINKEQENHD